MGRIEDGMIAARNVIREKKGLKPIAAGDPPPKKVVIPEVLPNASQLSDAEATKELLDWQCTMLALTSLEDVYRWSDKARPGVALNLAKQETACRLAAENGPPENYHRLKQGYLKAVGEFCQFYWMEHQKDPYKDIVCLGFGGKTIRIYADPQTKPEPGTPPAFYAREIPALLTTPEEELQRILNTKEVFPGSIIEYMT